MRVISSPSSSTTGFFTLILAMGRAMLSATLARMGSARLARTARRSSGSASASTTSWFLDPVPGDLPVQEQLRDDAADASEHDGLRRRGGRRVPVLRLDRAPRDRPRPRRARARASRSSGIDLFLFGGVMHMAREPATPGAEFRIAVAGPLVTLLIVVVGGALGVGSLGGPGRLRRRRARRRRRDDLGGRCRSLSRSSRINVVAARLQPDPRLPARRRPDRARGRVEGRPATATRARASPPRSARASAAC